MPVGHMVHPIFISIPRYKLVLDVGRILNKWVQDTRRAVPGILAVLLWQGG